LCRSCLAPQPGTDHAAYIQSWLKVLKNDKRAIFSAAAHAQKAADFLHGLQPTVEQSESQEGVAA
jgi:antirestriction protein ArdC